MSYSLERGTITAKVTNERLIDLIDKIEEIQKELDAKDEKIDTLETYIEGQNEVAAEMARVIRDNEYISIAK